MYGKVNPSGTCERHGLIQTRLDFFLEEGDYRYDDPRFYIVDETSEAYLAGYTGKDSEKWLATLPRVWLKERCFHSHFIYLDPYTLTEKQVEDAIALHLPNFYKAWVDEWDKVAGGMRHGWDVATRKRPTRFDIKEPELYEARKAECLSKVSILAVSDFAIQVTSVGETFPSTDIDVGSEATDRASYYAYQYSSLIYTLVDESNPANDTGVLDTVETWHGWVNGGSTPRVGTFSKSSTTYTCRDGQSLGTATAGSKQTHTGLDVDIASGDFIGIDSLDTTGYLFIEMATTGGTLAMGHGSFCDATDSFSDATLSDGPISLYGTGDTPVPPEEGEASDSATTSDSATYEVGYNFAISDSATTSDAAYIDIKGVHYKAKVLPKNPYTVQLAPKTPYEVKLMPKEPYTVVILEDE
jgi:hypothetical protein